MDIFEPLPENPFTILIAGRSGAGKTEAVKGLRDQEEWLYAAAEGKLPAYKNGFHIERVIDPYDFQDIMADLIEDQGCRGLVLDSLTFLAKNFNATHIHGAKDGRAAWGDFAMFFTNMFLQDFAKFNRPVIVLAHTETQVIDDPSGTKRIETRVPISGQLKSTGIESFFNTAVVAKRMPIKELAPYLVPENTLLTLSDREKRMGVKHVFQIQPTATTLDETIKVNPDMLHDSEVFMDNNVQVLLDRMHAYLMGTLELPA